MYNLFLQSEFTFKDCFAPLKRIVSEVEGSIIGIADKNNTFAHVLLEKECKSKNIKPVFGVRLEVVPDDKVRVRGFYGPEYIFVAKDEYGLFEINRLTKTAWDNFYFKPMVKFSDVLALSNSVVVITSNPFSLDRLDYLGLGLKTPPMTVFSLSSSFETNTPVPLIFTHSNRYIKPVDEQVYQLFAGTVKRGDGFMHKFNSQTYPQHVLDAVSAQVHLSMFGFDDLSINEALANTVKLADECNVKIPKAPMVKFISDKPADIYKMCADGARRLKIDISQGEYKERLDYELDLIHKKDFVDYFLIVADVINHAKKTMFVGPARGSAAGSLVCYLIGITEVDPIIHGLLFERFIDLNREDIPDIDVDFPDDQREDVIKYLFDKYGKDNVCHISNINRLKAKSAIEEFGRSLCIPKYEVDVLKDSIVDRSGGDARAAMAIADTIDTTDAGKKFIEKFPAMNLVKDIEGHATHAGKHAAGIIVCNEPLYKYGAVNSRESSIQMDKKGAEYLNLLKIDALGLRTLSILADAATQAGFDYREFYSMPLDNQPAFQILNSMRLNGIFQFEGQAMRMLCSQMGVEHFDDIVVLTALARPGPLHSGGADEYVKRRTGQEETVYISNNAEYIKETKDTYGVIVYQEQLMNLCRSIGMMSWEDVSEIRKAASKTLGKEFFNRYRDKFLIGAEKNGLPEDEAITVWDNMMTFGSWGMNKSHTVSYGLISYWCAYMKANYPLEFTAANLRHSKSKDQAIRILRDAYENDGIEYTPIDPDDSLVDWSVVNGRLLGGLIGINGIGEKKAQDIILMRQGKKKWSPSVIDILMDPKTDYDTIYPCRDAWSHVYANPDEYGAPGLCEIKNVQEPGTYTVIGMLRSKDLRDLNEYNELVKRGGKVYEDNNFTLKFVIEDDTDQIHCKINRFNFDKLAGRTFAETGIVDKTYYILRGKIKAGWRIIDIDAMYDLTADPDNIFKVKK